MSFPEAVPNFISGEDCLALGAGTFVKVNPHDEECLGAVARSTAQDVTRAVEAAKKAQQAWADMPGVRRGAMLFDVVSQMQARFEELASCVSLETGKSMKDAKAEVEGAIACGRFFAAEGQRLHGRTMPTSVENRWMATVREPVGVAGLIVAANTPSANVAWKVFPALICGNACVLKAAEDTPATAWLLGHICADAGLPKGVLNVLQGYGKEAGEALVEHSDVGVISFTGSTAAGRRVYELASKRLARVSLELGGKNPFVVLDDADLQNAVTWALLSAFSNAGQRCASASRIIVQEQTYGKFKAAFLEAALSLRLGNQDSDDLGPVINERQLTRMIRAVAEARARGAVVLCGGERYERKGYYMKPTVLEGVDMDDELSQCELFGPVTALYKARDCEDAVALANSTTYGLTASVHTSSVHKAMEFCRRVRAGVVQVNGPTYGSEAHMPFGGSGYSGNGSREPGTEALDVYSNLKNLIMNHTPGLA